MSLASQGSGSTQELWKELSKAASRGGSGAVAQTGVPTPPMPATAKPPSSSTSNNAPTAPATGTPSPFDPAADPVYMQVQAQMTAANAMAQGQALSQEEQELLNLGDPGLATAMLGADSPYVAAVQNNPESQYAQLQRQYQQELQQFMENIDPSLVNSGYRVLQEGNMSQALQDQRAAAEQQAQAQIQQYMDQLAGTKAQNADTLTQALSDAYNRYVQDFLNNPPAGPSGPSGGNPGPPRGTPAPPPPRHHVGSGRRIAQKSRHGRSGGGGGRPARTS